MKVCWLDARVIAIATCTDRPDAYVCVEAAQARTQRLCAVGGWLRRAVRHEAVRGGVANFLVRKDSVEFGKYCLSGVTQTTPRVSSFA